MLDGNPVNGPAVTIHPADGNSQQQKTIIATRPPVAYRGTTTEAMMETRRIIYSIECELDPLPGSPPGASSAIILPLNRDGMAISRNGRPRPPKRRTIDLRVGDDVMVDRQWRKVLGVKACRDGWRSGKPPEDDRGYVVR